MFRREFVVDAGLQFQTLHNTNDMFFIYSALAMSSRIAVVNRPLVYYRVGMTTNLQATKKRAPLCFYEAYKAVHDKLAELEILDGLRRSFVNRALNSCGHNLDVAQDEETRQQICDKLLNGGFEELEMLGYEPDYYYNKQRYQQIMELVSASKDKGNSPAAW